MPGFDDSPRSPIVLATAAYGRFVRGDHDSSIAYAEMALAASLRLGTSSSGLAERVLGNSWCYRGDADVAQQWIERMVDDASTGSPARLAHALYMRSVAVTSGGDPDRGGIFADQALAAARRVCVPDRPRPGLVRARSLPRRARSHGRRGTPATCRGDRRRRRQPLGAGVRAHPGAVAGRPARVVPLGAGRVRRRHRHVVPRRRLGEPVALAAPRLPHPGAARRQRRRRDVARCAHCDRRRLRPAVRGVRRRADRRARRRTA